MTARNSTPVKKKKKEPCDHAFAYPTSQSSVGMWANMLCPDCGKEWYWDAY